MTVKNKKRPVFGQDALPEPPSAPQRPVTITRHGIRVTDPYAWLKDPGYPAVTDADVLAYLKAENDYFDAAMAPQKALTETIFSELKARQKADDRSVPWTDGDWEYQWRFETAGEYRKWLRRPSGSSGDDGWHVILDEPERARNFDFFTIGGLAVSPDGTKLAWTEDTSGSERFRLRIRDLDHGGILEETIDQTIGTPVWAADSRTVVYLQVNDNWRPWRVYAHRIGTDPKDDRLIYEETDPSFFIGLGKTQDRRFLVISAGDHVTSETRLVSAEHPGAEPLLVAPRQTGHEYDVESFGPRVLIRSNFRHRNFGLYSAPLADLGSNPDKWETVIEGSDPTYLHGIAVFEKLLVIEERRDGIDHIRLRTVDHDNLAGDDHDIEFPEHVRCLRLGVNAEYTINRLRLVYESMITPVTIFDYDLADRRLIARKVQEIPSGYDKTKYRTERLMAPARDGAKVPISIVYHADFPQDGSGPLHLYGYGAYGHGLAPYFSTARLSLLDRGIAFAIAHVRGGDELGRGWYEAGKGAARVNTFHDFIDAARHLIDRDYCRRGHISASGGSAGGKLMGAIANMDPGMWRAIVAHVPFVDVLNTMLDESLPLTPIEWPEWGNPIEEPEAFRTIQSYSPYDNVTAQEYPPMMVTAGLNDPRVTYWEPAKWVARLRANKTDNNLLVLKTNMDAGHKGKSGRYQRLRETAEEYTFLLMAHGLADECEVTTSQS